MVKVELKKDLVSFQHQNGFLKFELRIPLENIDSVSTETVEPPPWFGTREDKTFYYVRNGTKCIILNLKNHEYSKVVVEVDDKESIAQMLRKSMEPPPKFSLEEYRQTHKVFPDEGS